MVIYAVFAINLSLNKPEKRNNFWFVLNFKVLRNLNHSGFLFECLAFVQTRPSIRNPSRPDKIDLHEKIAIIKIYRHFSSHNKNPRRIANNLSLKCTCEHFT